MRKKQRPWAFVVSHELAGQLLICSTDPLILRGPVPWFIDGILG